MGAEIRAMKLVAEKKNIDILYDEKMYWKIIL
jgi:hypothetical protein